MDFAVLNLNILRSPIQNESFRGLDFPNRDDCAGFQIPNHNVSGVVRDIQSIRIAHGFPGTVHHQKCRTGERIVVCPIHEFMDDQRGKRGIIKRQTVAGCGAGGSGGADRQQAGPDRADLDGLRFPVEDISPHCPHFPDHDCRTRN